MKESKRTRFQLKVIQFQIMLKGFTDVGTTLGTILEDSISGYIEEDY